MIFRAARLKIHYTRRRYQRIGRLLFPSPAEVRFIRLMGGRVLIIPFIRLNKNKFSLAIVLSFGRTLRREFVVREMRVGAMYMDFAFVTKYQKRAIEIDGAAYHADILKEQERDEYLAERGWQIMHIRGYELWRNPDGVKSRVQKFLEN